MDLQEMMNLYYEDGLSRELAAARVCQDIVLKAIAIGPLSRNVTIKGGFDMQNNIGETICQYRQMCKLTQEEFASRIGVTAQAVSNLYLT